MNEAKSWLDDDRTDVKRRDAALVIAAVRTAWLEQRPRDD
jgi:hypothetical protein